MKYSLFLCSFGKKIIINGKEQKKFALLQLIKSKSGSKLNQNYFRLNGIILLLQILEFFYAENHLLPYDQFYSTTFLTTLHADPFCYWCEFVIKVSDV